MNRFIEVILPEEVASLSTVEEASPTSLPIILAFHSIPAETNSVLTKHDNVDTPEDRLFVHPGLYSGSNCRTFLRMRYTA